jgi:hypothetical protein
LLIIAAILTVYNDPDREAIMRFFISQVFSQEILVFSDVINSKHLTDDAIMGQEIARNKPLPKQEDIIHLCLCVPV